MSSQEPPSIAQRDWRLQAISTLAEDYTSPTGIVHKKGGAVEWITFVEQGGQALDFPVPNPPSLLLSLAHRLASSSLPDARSGRRAIRGRAYSGKDHRSHHVLDETEQVCLISAIEAFANQSIPADFEWRTPRKDGRFDEVYNRDQIERFVSLDRKLDEILPDILGVASPKGTEAWRRYREVDSLRDRVIHLKNRELEPVDRPAPDNFWSMLLGPIPLEAPSRAIALIRHFAANANLRWVKKCPIP